MYPNLYKQCCNSYNRSATSDSGFMTSLQFQSFKICDIMGKLYIVWHKSFLLIETSQLRLLDCENQFTCCSGKKFIFIYEESKDVFKPCLIITHVRSEGSGVFVRLGCASVLIWTSITACVTCLPACVDK